MKLPVDREKTFFIDMPDGDLYLVTHPDFTCGVVVRDSIIIETAPILRKFKGQPLPNLERWVSRLGGTVALVRENPHD